MATKRIHRPRDPIELAKLIGDIAVGVIQDNTDDGKDPQAVVRGALGGKKGGIGRANKLSPDAKSEIARNAAATRWKAKRQS